jgi:8-hydroxy-5-deazaflavin:NADPH oxidoreductase
VRIAVLGSGSVGQAISAGLLRLGHEVVMATRDPEASRIQEWIGSSGGVQAKTFGEAARWCETAFLCTKWSGTENALQLAGAAALAGKVVVDVTNPLRVTGQAIELDIEEIGSGGEQVQRWLPGSKVVKSLNVLNAAYMLNAHRDDGGEPVMFVAGNDDAAKQEVATLLESAGWSVTDLGGIEKSRLLEALAMLWITVARQRQEFDFAFQPVGLKTS